VVLPRLVNLGESFVEQRSTAGVVAAMLMLRNIYDVQSPDQFLRQWISNNRRNMDGKVFCRLNDKDEPAWKAIREAMKLQQVLQTTCKINAEKSRPSTPRSAERNAKTKSMLQQQSAAISDLKTLIINMGEVCENIYSSKLPACMYIYTNNCSGLNNILDSVDPS